MRQQPEQFEPDNSNRAPDTLIPNVTARLGLDASNQNEPTSIEEIQEQLHADDWQIRLAAVEALGRQHTQLPVETLLAMLQDSDASVRAAIVRIVGHTNDEEQLKRLHVALHDPDWHVRETAIFVLGNSAYPPLELLVTAQSAEDTAVRDAATMMLQEIQGDQIVIQPLSVPEANEESLNGHIQLHVGTQQTSIRQADSALSKVYGYMNFLWSLPRTKGGRSMLREHTHVNENRQTETRPTRKARKPMVRIVEGVLAAVLILGLVASWLIVSQRFHTSTAGSVLLQRHLSRDLYPNPYSQWSWSPDGKQLILTNFGQPSYLHQTDNVYVWDIATNTFTKTLSFTDGDAKTFGITTMSLDGSYVGHVKDDLLQVWDTRTGRTVLTYKNDVTLSDTEWSSDGRYIAAIDRANIVRVWDIKGGTTSIACVVDLHPSDATPISIRWSPDSKHLLVSYTGGPIQIWDPFTETKLQTIVDTTLGVASWLDATRIMVSALFDPVTAPKASTSIRVWDALTGHKLVTYTGHTMVPTQFQYSTDKRRIFSISSDEYLLWDTTTGKTILRIPKGGVLGIPSLSPDGTFVEATDGIDTIQIWDATTGNSVANYHVDSSLLPSGNNSRDSVSWFDEKSLISEKQNGEVHIFDALTGQVRYSFDVHISKTSYLEWSSDHKKIVVVLDNGTVEILQGID